MNNIYRIIILLLVISFTACTSTQQRLSATYDEDRDVGLGGTGILATMGDEDNDGGLGGTGILGEITGFGSIFVNGIEIEYDNDTPFTIDGKAASPQQLEIGDVVEVLAMDSANRTRARLINLRHEIIGRVDSVGPDTFSFTVEGQSIVQAIDVSMPKSGDMVAISGFRIDEQTIVATRVTPTDAKQTLLRTHTTLPFKDKTARWLVQTYVHNYKAVVQLDGVTHVLIAKEKTGKSSNEGLGIRILQLQKSASGQIKLEQVIEEKGMPRGQFVPRQGQWSDGNRMYQHMYGPESGYGGGQESGAGSGSGSGQESGQRSQSGNRR